MNANIRIGRFGIDAPNVDVLVGGESVLEDVPFGTTSDFLSVEAGSLDVAVVPSEGGDAVVETTLDLAAGASYTVLAVGELPEITPLVLTDEFGRIDVADDEAGVRLVHASPDAPAVDVAVRSDPTLFENVEFGEFSEFATVDAGSYDVDVLPAGSDDAVLSLTDLSIDGGRLFTVVATGSVADDSLAAEILVDVPPTIAGRTAAKR